MLVIIKVVFIQELQYLKIECYLLNIETYLMVCFQIILRQYFELQHYHLQKGLMYRLNQKLKLLYLLMKSTRLRKVRHRLVLCFQDCFQIVLHPMFDLLMFLLQRVHLPHQLLGQNFQISLHLKWSMVQTLRKVHLVAVSTLIDQMPLM